MTLHSFWAAPGTATEPGGPPTVRFEVEQVGAFPPPTDALLQEAVALLNQHFFSAGFRAQVLAATMTEDQGLTPAEVYQKLVQPTVGTDRIGLRLGVYSDYAGGGEVGVTTREADGRQLTRTFQDYITTNGAACYAAHLAHEYCHWVGFTHHHIPLVHPKHKTVPYVVGNLFARYLGATCP